MEIKRALILRYVISEKTRFRCDVRGDFIVSPVGGQELEIHYNSVNDCYITGQNVKLMGPQRNEGTRE